MISPDGKPGNIPQENLSDAMAKGYKVATRVTSPEGVGGWMAHDQVNSALSENGFRLGDPSQQNLGQTGARPQNYGFTPGNILSNAYEGAKGVVGGTVALAKDLASNPNWFESTPGRESTMDKFVINPMMNEGMQAQQAFRQGRVSEGLAHGLASGIPFVGPFAASLGQQAGTGDIGGMLGQAGGAYAGGKAISKIPAAVKSVVGSAKPYSLPANVRALSGRTYTDPTIEHLRGTANDLGLQEQDFSKGNANAEVNANRVHDEAGRNAAATYNSLWQPIANKISQLPQMPAALRAKLAGSFTLVDPQMPARIMSGQTTVGDLEAIRQRLNGLYSDEAYQSEEKDYLKNEFGPQLRGQLYDEIAKTGVDAGQLSQLKKIQGDLLKNEQGFKSGTRAAGNFNSVANSGNRVQNFMRNSPLMKFKGGMTKGVVETVAGSADKAALLEKMFKGADQSQSFNMQPGTNIPAAGAGGGLTTPRPPIYGGWAQQTPASPQTPAQPTGAIPPQTQIPQTQAPVQLGSPRLLPATTGETATPAAQAPVQTAQPATQVSSQPETQAQPVTQVQPESKIPQPGTDRRQNFPFRKFVSEMTPEEMRQELLTQQVTQMPNVRAFHEADAVAPAKFYAMSDADGLKALNDKFGYDAGNELLKAKANALKQAGLEAYHEKGDEFRYRGATSLADLQAKLEKARQILKNTVIRVTKPDGTVMKFTGADFSYGAGENIPDAETNLKSHKEQREASGERARGELRGITKVESK